MKRSLKIIATTAIIFSIVASSIYLYSSSDHFRKSKVINLMSSSYRDYVNPYNNSNDTVFVLNFTLNHYSGGPITFTPSFQVNSSVNNISEVNRIWNLTTSTYNHTLSSPYWSEFYTNVLISPFRNNANYGNYEYLQGQAGSTGIGYVTVLWSQSNGDILPAYMDQVNIPPGNYNISVSLKYQAHQPSQTTLNVINGSAWVTLDSLQITSQTTLNGAINVSNIKVSSRT